MISFAEVREGSRFLYIAYNKAIQLDAEKRWVKEDGMIIGWVRATKIGLDFSSSIAFSFVFISSLTVY